MLFRNAADIENLRKINVLIVNKTGTLTAGRFTFNRMVLAPAVYVDKLALVERFQAEGQVLAMARDGISDAPASAKAHVAITMGTGIDIAMSSAQVTSVNENLQGISTVRKMSEATVAEILKLFTFIRSLQIITKHSGKSVFFSAIAVAAAMFLPTAGAQT